MAKKKQRVVAKVAAKKPTGGGGKPRKVASQASVGGGNKPRTVASQASVGRGGHVGPPQGKTRKPGFAAKPVAAPKPHAYAAKFQSRFRNPVSPNTTPKEVHLIGQKSTPIKHTATTARAAALVKYPRVKASPGPHKFREATNFNKAAMKLAHKRSEYAKSIEHDFGADNPARIQNYAAPENKPGKVLGRDASGKPNVFAGGAASIAQISEASKIRAKEAGGGEAGRAAADKLVFRSSGGRQSSRGGAGGVGDGGGKVRKKPLPVAAPIKLQAPPTVEKKPLQFIDPTAEDENYKGGRKQITPIRSGGAIAPSFSNRGGDFGGKGRQGSRSGSTLDLPPGKRRRRA